MIHLRRRQASEACGGSPVMPADLAQRTGIRQRFRSAHAVVALLCFIATGGAFPSPSMADDRDRVRLAVRHLVGLQLPSGLFRYDFDFLRDAPTGEDHIVRQAGVAYALGEYLVATQDAHAAAAIQAVLTKFGDMSLPISRSWIQSAVERTGLLSLPFARYKLRATLDWLDLLYRPNGDGKVVSYNGTYQGAEAGATALALLAELQYARASGDTRFADLRRSWLNGLLSLRIAGHGFRYQPRVIDEDPYYNGEIWLTLAYYADMFPDDADAVAVLEEADDYLMDKYFEDPSAAFFHWGLMAAAHRYANTADPRFAVFVEHQVRHYLDKIWPRIESDLNSCAALEGLIPAASLLQRIGNRSDLVDRIRTLVGSELTKIRRLQIGVGQRRIETEGGAYVWSSRLPDYEGAFLGGLYRPETRIDFTQHCVSALLKAGGSGLAPAG